MPSRAEFLQSTVAVAATAGMPSFPAGGSRKPPMLRKGDVVGLVAPASPLTDTEIAKGVKQIEALGLRVRLGRYVRSQDGYLAGTDAERAGDFNAMIADKEVRAIVALRGGYGTMRILPALNYAGLKRAPKIVMGFSDMTAVLNAVATHSGIVTFHGPVAALSTFTPFVMDEFQRALMSTKPIGSLYNPGTLTLHGGAARGPLAGGNLSLVSGCTGTPYAVATQGSMLFLEETEEEAYRVDRMLTQLELAGDFKRAVGIVFGACSHCDDSGNSLSLAEVYKGTIGRAGRPAVSGAKIGHITNQWILPIGVEARLDANTGTLTIAESGVSA